MPARSTRRNRSTAPPAKAKDKESGRLARALHPRRRDPRLGVPELGRRAVQYPVGIDAADAVHRRLSGRRRNGPTAIRATAFRSALPPFEGRLFERLPHRGDVVVFRHPSENADLIKRVIGLPGDTIAVRGGRLILNGRPVPRARLAARKRRGDANSPCRVVPARHPDGRPAARSALCLYPRLPRDASRRPELHGARPGRSRAGRRLSGNPRARGPRLPDGRQSRRQSRQPLPTL